MTAKRDYRAGQPLRFVSLFAGIGGIDLGLERAGFQCAGQVEIDDYCQKVLAKHWPDVPRISDVRDFQGHEFGEFDLLTGGYPCQPFSIAGERRGEADERHLWPEVLRILRAVRPRAVLLENVPGHLSLGFGRVQGDLAESGYDTEWDCIPAAAVGAPHIRDRVFILAYPQRGQRREATATGQRLGDQGDSLPTGRHEGPSRAGRSGEAMAHSDGPGRAPAEHREGHALHRGDGDDPAEERGWDLEQFRARASGQWAAEPSVGRVADGIPHRVDRLRGLGNTVVPQVAELFGHQLHQVLEVAA